MSTATVRALLANSVRVVAVDINAPKLASRANEWRDKATAVVRDAADVEDVAGVVALCEERFGRLDGFVANAAITRAGNAVNMTPATWDEVMAINLRSVYLAAHFAIPAFRRAGGGSLVVVASQVGLVGYPDNVAYCAAKGGLINLTKALALDHAAEGIRVNNVCPGPIETEMLRAARRASSRSAVCRWGAWAIRPRSRPPWSFFFHRPPPSPPAAHSWLTGGTRLADRVGPARGSIGVPGRLPHLGASGISLLWRSRARLSSRWGGANGLDRPMDQRSDRLPCPLHG
jgi:NAD(P)-dependent dehydrogenase (short-subunit alcohol dehydrogenase family)